MWQSIAPLPAGRSDAAAAVHPDTGQIYVVGGLSRLPFDSTRSVFIYDAETNRWSNGPDVPEPFIGLRGPGAVILANYAPLGGGDFLFVLGGNTHAFTDTRLQRLDLASGIWTTFSTSNIPKLVRMGVNYDPTTTFQEIYQIGGETSTGGTQSSLTRIDPVTIIGTTLAPKPVRGSSFGVHFFSGDFYAVSGFAFDSANGTDANEVYDIASNTWSLAERLPLARGGSATASYGQYFLVAGGASNRNTCCDNVFSRFDIYDPIANFWTEGPPLPENLRFAAGAVSGDYFYVFGGTSSSSDTPRIEAYRIRIITEPQPLPGDFNNDGAVDGADYVVWRKGLGTTHTESDYDLWRANFGRTAASGSSSTRPVPEPQAFAMLLVAVACGMLCGRRRATSNYRVIQLEGSASMNCSAPFETAPERLTWLPKFASRRRCARAAVTILSSMVIVVVAPTALAQTGGVTFRKIADTSGPFFSFNAAVVDVNNTGAVAFSATLDAGGQGIFTGSNLATDTVMLPTPGQTTLDFFDLGEGGHVIARVFNTPPGQSQREQLRMAMVGGAGGEGSIFLDARTSEFSGFGPPFVNASGIYAFAGNIRPGGAGNSRAFRGPSSTELTTVARGSTMGVGGINSANLLTFFDRLSAVHKGSTETDHVLIADVSGPFQQFTAATLNDDGVVAFLATRDNTGSGVFQGTNAENVITVADSLGLFLRFTDVAINNRGTTVFRADLDNLSSGLFTGPDPVSDKIIRTGDNLFGSTLSAVGFYRGLNDHGVVAFRYALANGEQGIAAATLPGDDPVLPGDYNQNGAVDAADYVVWRKTDGSQAGYDLWRTNFGRTAGSGSAAISPSHITAPEPTNLILIAALSLTFLSRWRVGRNIR